MSESTIAVNGLVHRPGLFTREDLAGSPAEHLVADISAIAPHRQGTAVSLHHLINESQPDDSATYVTLHSADGFAASIPLADVRETGLIIFEIDGQPLPESAGGPFRFLIPNAAACRTAELDACANVKQLAEIELTNGRGRDTR